MELLNTYGKKIITSVIVLTILTGCKERYDPQIEFTDTGFLVVEGYINIGTKAVTTVMLSRTTPLDESSVKIYETGASVSFENSLGESFQLFETQAGTYISDSLSLSLQELYRLKVSIADKIYFSEFVTPIITPEIDSVSWSLRSEGVVIGVSTHDATNLTHQYQWEFDEVWETHSTALSLYDYNGGDWINRPAQEVRDMQTCWTYRSVTDFNILSTKNLAQNIVLNRSVKKIPLNDVRLDVRYSITVKQHALSNEAYNYIQLILSNNENVGTFSDPMPGQLIGNMYCTSTSEPVVGFIDAYSTTYKRISIYRREVPNWNYQTGCRDTLVSLLSSNLNSLMGGNRATRFHFAPGEGLPIRDSVYLMPSECVDCRIKGGINIRPSFWKFGQEDEE